MSFSKREAKLVRIYLAFICVLIAVALIVPYSLLGGDNAVFFVIFGSIGATYFWVQFKPLPLKEVVNEEKSKEKDRPKTGTIED